MRCRGAGAAEGAKGGRGKEGGRAKLQAVRNAPAVALCGAGAACARTTARTITLSVHACAHVCADVITTFTYQASLPGFAEAGVDAAHAGRLLNLAVDLAEAARAHFMREQEQERGQEQEQGKEQDQGKEPGHQGQGQEQGKEREQGKEQGEEQEQQESGQHGQRLRGAGSSAAGGGSGSGDSRRHAAAGRRRRPLIAYSCGSYGAYLADGSEFQGDYADSVSTDALIEFHRARLDPVRSRHEIDLIAFETVPCLKEAEAIVELLRRER